MTPFEFALSLLAWGVVALLAIIIVIVLALVVRAGYKAIREFGSDQNGRK